MLDPLLAPAPPAADAPGLGSSEPGAVLLARAAERAYQLGRPYYGEVTPAEAWALHQRGDAALVDVRTEPEWRYVGRIEGVPLVEWRRYEASTPNPDFIVQLAALVPRDQAVLFLCRSGVRSQAAAQAATAAGWRAALNVMEGFEGDLDDRQQRGQRGGWRQAGLPWVQS